MRARTRSFQATPRAKRRRMLSLISPYEYSEAGRFFAKSKKIMNQSETRRSGTLEKYRLRWSLCRRRRAEPRAEHARDLLRERSFHVSLGFRRARNPRRNRERRNHGHSRERERENGRRISDAHASVVRRILFVARARDHAVQRGTRVAPI